MIYLLFSSRTTVTEDFGALNWTSVAFGFVLVALEAGWLYVYRAGWQVSLASIVQSSLLALILMLVGFFAYKETLTWNKIAGILVCLAGLGLINLK